MIAAHCEAQAAARHDLAVDGHGLRRDRTHGEDPRLRRIDHRGELIDVEHPQIRDGKGGARVLSGLEPTATGLVGELARLAVRSEEHTSELQSRLHLVCRLLLEKKKTKTTLPRSRT